MKNMRISVPVWKVAHVRRCTCIGSAAPYLNRTLTLVKERTKWSLINIILTRVSKVEEARIACEAFRDNNNF